MNARAGIPYVRVAADEGTPSRSCLRPVRERSTSSFSSWRVRHPPFESVCTSTPSPSPLASFGPAPAVVRARTRSAAGRIDSTKRRRRKKSIGFERTSRTVESGYCSGRRQAAVAWSHTRAPPLTWLERLTMFLYASTYFSACFSCAFFVVAHKGDSEIFFGRREYMSCWSSSYVSPPRVLQGFRGLGGRTPIQVHSKTSLGPCSAAGFDLAAAAAADGEGLPLAVAAAAAAAAGSER